MMISLVLRIRWFGAAIGTRVLPSINGPGTATQLGQEKFVV
jgi:hypothetical protein